MAVGTFPVSFFGWYSEKQQPAIIFGSYVILQDRHDDKAQ
jgi:hypothetical protein